MAIAGFGTSRPRVEDERFVTGRGSYSSDKVPADSLRAEFVRARVAAARVTAIRTEAALAAPGVVAVLTARDLRAAGVRAFSLAAKVAHVDGGFSTETPRDLLVADTVRFAGEPIAMVLATSAWLAQDAAELVEVDYEELPAMPTPVQAAAADARRIWPDRKGNIAFHWRRGDPDELGRAFAASRYVIAVTSSVSRVAAMPLEPRSATAWTGEDGRRVLRVSHQSPHGLRAMLCDLFGLDRGDIRVLAPDVGGSFGMKSGLLREEALVFWAARQLGRAIHWTAGRGESFLSDEHARDTAVRAELGLTADGVFTALKVRYDINIGAYLSARSLSHIRNFGGIAGVYRTPVIVGEAVGYFTNTPPTAAYRGAGRPDATYAIERVIDAAARELGMDPARLRLLNLIPPDAMPYQTPFVFRYDCGEFERNMARALDLAGYDAFAERRAEALSRGRLRGIGIGNPIEVAAGPFAKPATDYATVRVNPDGTVSLFSGAVSVGQGLETALSSIVAGRLGIPLDRIRYLQGDTDLLADGKGNGGSAALTLCGSAISLGIDALLRKATDLAAEELEASPLDLEYARGAFHVVGSDRAVTIGALATTVETAAGGVYLDGAGAFSQTQPTYPNGCHICEVEIDPETGGVEIVRYVCVEDLGRVLNPLLLAGQLHGGVAQGIGQALLEQIRFDTASQLLTGSFMDYAMPRADALPMIVSETLEVPTQLNPLGVKGVGEAGTVGSLAATMNAVCNALAPLGIRHFDMPATPCRVWTAIQEARNPTDGASSGRLGERDHRAARSVARQGQDIV